MVSYLMDVSWKKYEKDIHSNDLEKQIKSLDAFDEERTLQLKTSEKARSWEKGRKQELAKNKPLWRKEIDTAKKEKADKSWNNLLKAGTFVSDLIPAPGYILITVDIPEVKTDSGIILQNEVAEPNEGIVIEVGKPLVMDRFTQESPCSVGDRVLFKRGAGLAIMIKDKTCKLIYFPDVLGTFKADAKN